MSLTWDMSALTLSVGGILLPAGSPSITGPVAGSTEGTENNDCNCIECLLWPGCGHRL